MTVGKLPSEETDWCATAGSRGEEMTGFIPLDLDERFSESEGRIWRVRFNGRSNRERFFGTVPVHLYIRVDFWLEALVFGESRFFKDVPGKSVMSWSKS